MSNKKIYVQSKVVLGGIDPEVMERYMEYDNAAMENVQLDRIFT